jgi:biopolymer transport protein ExbD
MWTTYRMPSFDRGYRLMRQNRSGTSRSSRVRRVLVEANFILATSLAILSGLGVSSRGDEFSRLEGAYLFDLTGRADLHGRTSVSVRVLEELPAALRGESATLVLARTDQGNLAKLLVSSGMRKLKPSEKQGTLVPVLILERYETIDAGDRRSVRARGKELMLFDGFQFDLDTGQVVPAGMGGDILFSTAGPDGPKLTALDKDRLYTFEKPLPALPSAPGRPSAGRVVQPGDYAGRYHLIANGQWSGTLDLTIDAGGMASGRFRSDLNGSVYAVTGQAAMEAPKKIAFDVQFPQARQSYEGLLWTEGKNAFAGTVSMLDRPYSFIAIREGTSLWSEEIDLGLMASSTGDKSSRRIIISLDAATDRFTLDAKPCSSTELAEALSRLVKAEPTSNVLLRVPDSVPFERVRRAVESIRAAGVKSVRVAPSTETSGTE